MKKSPSKKITKKALESMPLHNDVDVKRYIGFVTETHRDEFKVLSENITGLGERMDRRFTSIDEKLDKHEQILNRHEHILHGHGKKLDVHTDMIGRVMIDVEDIKINMREKVSREEFNKLETRLVSLETIVFSYRSKGKLKS